MSFYSKSFCALPFRSFATNNQGRLKLCCNVQGEDYIEGPAGQPANIHQDSVKDFWNGPYLRKARQDMLAGRRVSACQYCYDMEGRGEKSSRQWANERLLGFKPDQAAHKAAAEAKRHEGRVSALPDSLELRLSNLCNLKCHSCWSLSSHKISRERSLQLKRPDIPLWLKKEWLFERQTTGFPAIQGLPANSSFEENFALLAPRLRRLYLSGGEPSLIKAYRTILKSLIENGNRGLELSMTINLTSVEGSFLSLLKSFSNLEVSCSIDGFQLANDYIRHPSLWDKIEGNLRKLKEALPEANIVIYCVYSIYNVFSIYELAQWLEREFEAPPALCVSWLRAPVWLRAENLPPRLKGRALAQHKKFMKKARFKNPLTEANMKSLPSFLSAEGRALSQFIEYTAFSDRCRGVSIKRFIPELGELL